MVAETTHCRGLHSTLIKSRSFQFIIQHSSLTKTPYEFYKLKRIHIKKYKSVFGTEFQFPTSSTSWKVDKTVHVVHFGTEFQFPTSSTSWKAIVKFSKIKLLFWKFQFPTSSTSWKVSSIFDKSENMGKVSIPYEFYKLKSKRRENNGTNQKISFNSLRVLQAEKFVFIFTCLSPS